MSPSTRGVCGFDTISLTCTCPYHQKNQLKQGPCEHILSLRLAHMARLEIEGKGEA